MYVHGFGHSLYVEITPARSTSPFFDRWQSLGENFLRVGRLSLIHTPPNWRERRAMNG